MSPKQGQKFKNLENLTKRGNPKPLIQTNKTEFDKEEVNLVSHLYC